MKWDKLYFNVFGICFKMFLIQNPLDVTLKSEKTHKFRGYKKVFALVESYTFFCLVHNNNDDLDVKQ